MKIARVAKFRSWFGWRNWTCNWIIFIGIIYICGICRIFTVECWELVESETNCRLFSTTQSFITGIVDIIRNFHSVFFRKLPLNTSYWSHFCYELALYILLGLVEKSELMKSFLTVIDDNSLKLLVDTLILILPMDVLYLSQVRKTYCLFMPQVSPMNWLIF